jgi:hypothetical protein
MAIVFVHGVATRDEDDPQFPAVERFARDANWPVVEAMLREHVAPVLRPADPAGVAIVRVYWGDLGMRPRVPLEADLATDLTPDLAPDVAPGAAGDDPAQDGGAGLGADDTAYPLPVDLEDVPNLAALTPAELGEALQRELFEALPPSQWAAVVRAVWDVVSESALRAQLAARAPRRQRAFVDDLVRERLKQEDPALGRVIRPVRTDLVAQGRKGIRRAMGGVRRPFAGILPIFVGDILRYLDGRGRPGSPGPVIERVLDGLRAAADASPAGEPLVVLTHSMGGQLVYDTVTAFDPGVRVDFWCASGGQVGFFVELGVLLEATDPDARPFTADTVGYFWNAWSSSDVLSFPTEGRVPGAHDSDFAYDGTLIANHMSYLHDPAFYATLAAKVAVHTRGRRRHMGG